MAKRSLSRRSKVDEEDMEGLDLHMRKMRLSKSYQQYLDS